MNFDIEKIIRANIKVLKPYTSARDEYKGKEGVFLDANENAFGSVTTALHNRYPDPLQWEVKTALGKIKNIAPENIFLGNGSDEAIDLVFRCFCEPGKDNIIITPPTYGMYEVSANINDVAIKKVSLKPDFSLNEDAVFAAADAYTKAVFLCSPNNPTGNSLKADSIETVLKNFKGLVVIDEAYIDYAPEKTWLNKLNSYSNLIVLQTFSKAWGMANLRLGIAYASQEIISIFNKVKPPYNVNGLTQQLALEALQNVDLKNALVAETLTQRTSLEKALFGLPFVKHIYPSDANFLLVKTTDGKKIYDFLVERKVIVRDRSNVALCEGCLRITIGTPAENEVLVRHLKEYV